MIAWPSQVLLEKPGNREIAAAIRDAGCETVIATGLSYGPTLYYQMVEDGAVVLPFPVDMGRHPGNLEAAAYTPAELRADAEVLTGRYPARDGLCALDSTQSPFAGHLAEAFPPGWVEIGSFSASLQSGVGYVLKAWRPTVPQGSAGSDR